MLDAGHYAIFNAMKLSRKLIDGGKVVQQGCCMIGSIDIDDIITHVPVSWSGDG